VDIRVGKAAAVAAEKAEKAREGSARTKAKEAEADIRTVVVVVAAAAATKIAAATVIVIVIVIAAAAVAAAATGVAAPGTACRPAAPSRFTAARRHISRSRIVRTAARCAA
jgi:hypothetical protein